MEVNEIEDGEFVPDQDDNPLSYNDDSLDLHGIHRLENEVNEPPYAILQTMMSALIPGECLISPLPESMLQLKNRERAAKCLVSEAFDEMEARRGRIPGKELKEREDEHVDLHGIHHFDLENLVDESPRTILQTMALFLDPGEGLLSPLPDTMLQLKSREPEGNLLGSEAFHEMGTTPGRIMGKELEEGEVDPKSISYIKVAEYLKDWNGEHLSESELELKGESIMKLWLPGLNKWHKREEVTTEHPNALYQIPAPEIEINLIGQREVSASTASSTDERHSDEILGGDTKAINGKYSKSKRKRQVDQDCICSSKKSKKEGPVKDLCSCLEVSGKVALKSDDGVPSNSHRKGEVYALKSSDLKVHFSASGGEKSNATEIHTKKRKTISDHEIERLTNRPGKRGKETTVSNQHKSLENHSHYFHATKINQSNVEAGYLMDMKRGSHGNHFSVLCDDRNVEVGTENNSHEYSKYNCQAIDEDFCEEKDNKKYSRCANGPKECKLVRSPLCFEEKWRKSEIDVEMPDCSTKQRIVPLRKGISRNNSESGNDSPGQFTYHRELYSKRFDDQKKDERNWFAKKGNIIKRSNVDRKEDNLKYDAQNNLDKCAPSRLLMLQTDFCSKVEATKCIRSNLQESTPRAQENDRRNLFLKRDNIQKRSNAVRKVDKLKYGVQNNLAKDEPSKFRKLHKVSGETNCRRSNLQENLPQAPPKLLSHSLSKRVGDTDVAFGREISQRILPCKNKQVQSQKFVNRSKSDGCATDTSKVVKQSGKTDIQNSPKQDDPNLPIFLSSMRKNHHLAASSTMKEAVQLKQFADRLKNDGSEHERTNLYFQAALKFLHFAFLCEPPSHEIDKDWDVFHAMEQTYYEAARLFEFCAQEYENCKLMAAAALAYKCVEVAYLKIAYFKQPSASKDNHELQTSLQMNLPSSPTTLDVDKFKSDGEWTKAHSSFQISENHSIATRDCPIFRRFLNYVNCIHGVFEATRKSQNAIAIAIVNLGQDGHSCISSLKKVIDFGFHDVERFIRLIRISMETIDP